MFRRKVIRELKENKLGYAACITVIAIGLMIYASFAVVSENLTASQVNFYRDQNFADGYADIMEMPAREVDRLKKIDGIRDLQGRTMEEVRVLFPGKTENVYLKLVSFDPRLNNPINAFMLTAGSLPDAQDSKKDIILDNKFFEANHLRLNDELEVVIKGKKVKFTVAGAARNPEFIYALRTAGDVFPDPEKYGVAYLPYETMQSLLGKKNTVNSIVFTLEPGTDFDDVKPVLERELKPYGILSLYPRKDQPSHLMLNQELDGIKATSRSMPAVFLTIAAVVLYIMMRRTVEQQRGQIGVLKALGYKDSEIMLHYLSYSVIIGLLGGALGGAAGIALSFPLTSAYEMFFNMPGLESRISLRYLLESLLISLIFSAAAGYSGCKGILALQPSQAMRPPTPSPGKQIPLERLGSFWNMLTVQGKMAFRNLYRNPKRSVIVFIGITFAFSLAGMTWATKQLSEKMLFEQFEKVETYDTKIIFTDPRKRDKALWELNRFPGVKKAEPLAEVPVTLKNKGREKNLVIIGLPRQNSLYNIIDKKGNTVEPPENGILVTERLARVLDIKPGDTVYIESPYIKEKDKEKQVQVMGTVPQYVGINGYMELNSLGELIGQRDITTSVLLAVNEKQMPELQEKYGNAQIVSNVLNRKEAFLKMKELMESYSWSFLILALFGVITSFAVIYNTSIISLSERSRELATMLVIGMFPSEVLSVVTLEQWAIALPAMMVGVPLTKLLLVGIAYGTSSDMFTMPTDMDPLSFIAAFIITSASIIIAQKAAARKINTLKLTDVLREQS